MASMGNTAPPKFRGEQHVTMTWYLPDGASQVEDNVLIDIEPKPYLSEPYGN